MPKGKHTPKSKKKRQRIMIDAEKKWLLGQERMRRAHQRKEQEAPNDRRKNNPARHNPTISNLERVRDAVQRRSA